jgi:hypothetical protein
MSDNLPVTPMDGPKKNNQGLIIGIVVVVLLCCCCAALVGLWFSGDSIVQSLNL